MRKTKYTVKYTTSFKKDYKRAIKRGLKIEVLEQAETAGIFDKAYPSVTDAIIAANGVEGIDVAAGATYSSNGLIEAVKDALSKVK